MALVGLKTSPTDLKEYTVAAYKESASWLRDYITAIKNGQFHPFTKLERKAREATRNEPWGPTGMLLNELAEATFNNADCEVIFAVVQLRLGYPPAKWRNVYKALTLLEFLVKRGSERAVSIACNEIMYRLEDLEGFQFMSPDGRDQGINVRVRAQAVRALLRDRARLKEERQTFKAKQRSYAGYSRDQMLMSPHSAGGFDSMGRAASLRRSRSDTESSFAGFDRQPQSPEQTTPQSRPPRSVTRGAGEMKGVTMEENKKQLAALRRLLERPENRSCADCTGGGAASRATWASINTGVFICMRCAGIHRGLGVHISKVRSCTLDTWLPEQVAFMDHTGNAKANAYYEAKLDPSEKPSYYSPDLEAFIRRKYNGAYAEGDWPPAEAFVDPATPAPAPAAERNDTQTPAAAASSNSAPPVRLAAPSSSGGAGSFWANHAPSTAPPQAPNEEHGFGESAELGNGSKRAERVPNMMDFNEDIPLHNTAQAQPEQQTGPIAACAAAPPRSGEVQAKGSMLRGFDELMAASAQPNLMDADPFSASAASGRSNMDILLLEPSSYPPQAAHDAKYQSSQQPADHSQPRALHSAFDAAAAVPGFGGSSLLANPPHASSGGFGMPAAPSAHPAHELSFDSDPVPDWGATAQQRTAPSAGNHFSAAVPPLHTNALALSLPAVPGAFPPQPAAGVSAFLHSHALVEQPGMAGGVRGVSQAPPLQGSRPAAVPGQRQPGRALSGKSHTADPTGFVLEDLLSHAVENMRIKNAGNTKFAARPKQQTPSLMEQKVGAHTTPAGF